MRETHAEHLKCIADPSHLLQRAGYEPEDFQYKICNLPDKRIYILAGRGSGKSLAISARMLMDAAVRKDTIVVAAPSKDQAGIPIRYCKELLSALPIRPGVVKSNESEIEFSHGSRILAVALGEEGVSARGYHGSRVYLDECGYIKSDIIRQVILPIIFPYGDKGRIICTSTPTAMQGWMYTQCCKPDARVVTAPLNSLKHINISDIDPSEFTADEYKREILAEWCEADGATFKFTAVDAAFSDEQGDII